MATNLFPGLWEEEEEEEEREERSSHCAVA
jgi:hypothetical protein